MTRVLLIRLVVFSLPFAGWFLWREVAFRLGRPKRQTPWAWLIGGGALLAGLTLVASAVFPGGPDRGTYVPAQVRADGAVSPGYFVARPPAQVPPVRR